MYFSGMKFSKHQSGKTLTSSGSSNVSINWFMIFNSPLLIAKFSLIGKWKKWSSIQMMKICMIIFNSIYFIKFFKYFYFFRLFFNRSLKLWIVEIIIFFKIIKHWFSYGV
jgi:hypothetical protein